MPKTAFEAILYAVKGRRALHVLVWSLSIVANAMMYVVLYFFKVTADIASEISPGDFDLSLFLFPITAVITALIIQQIIGKSTHLIRIPLSLGVYKRISTFLFENIIHRPSSFFEDRFSGEIGRRIEQISQNVRFMLNSFPNQLLWVLMGFVSSGVLLYITHTTLFMVYALWFVFFAVTSYPFLRYQYKMSENESFEHAKVRGSIIDTLTNMPLVHSFGSEDKEMRTFNKGFDVYLQADRKEWYADFYNRVHQGVNLVLLVVVQLVLSIMLFGEQKITIGDFLLVSTILPTLTGRINNFGDIVVYGIRKYGTISDAVKKLQTDVEKLDEGTQRIEANNTKLSFEGVTFKYPSVEEYTFENFSLELRQGEKVGVVGSSGAGKSTLVKLLLRQYDPESGSIKIGDVDTKEVSLQSLRESIAFVPQDTSLFHRTLFENIQYARPDATESEVLSAAKEAYAHNFIMRTPEKYESKVGERGIKLSGGQRQRIALARAMLKDAPILVLDEATSSLDSESEEIVQKGLRELFKNRTVIAVAHRLSTLKEMNRIVVMEKGKVVEDGTPRELLENEKSVFKAMWEHQKGGFITI